MKPSEAARVITAAAIVDKRTIGEADARMWAEILPPDLGPALAVQAVKAYYRENSRLIMPADVARYAARVQAGLRRECPMDLDAYREVRGADARARYKAAFYEAIASGQTRRTADVAARDAATPPRQVAP